MLSYVPHYIPLLAFVVEYAANHQVETLTRPEVESDSKFAFPSLPTANLDDVGAVVPSVVRLVRRW
eukprot:1115471-Pyramimonas_sp.AAC.1